MAKLLDLVESHPDVIVSIRAADLLAANEELFMNIKSRGKHILDFIPEVMVDGYTLIDAK